MFRKISKDWSVDNIKKTGFAGYVYDFSADYNAITVGNIKDIHNYLMKKIICKMGTTKQINIKNRTYYFYNDIIDLENFDAGLLKIDEKIIQRH